VSRSARESRSQGDCCAGREAVPRFPAVLLAVSVPAAATLTARQLGPNSGRQLHARESGPSPDERRQFYARITATPCPWFPSPLPGKLPKRLRGRNRLLAVFATKH